jgi:DNA helicase II / ATP-dependent DNA helicase PcrA
MESTTKDSEGLIFAQFVKYLKDNNIIEDYSDLALLLHSVRLNYSGHYIEGLKKLDIPYFAPRAKRFFENEEIGLSIACFALILNLKENISPNQSISGFSALRNYINNSTSKLKTYSNLYSQLEQYIITKTKSLENLELDERSSSNLLNIFYELLSLPPFSKFLENENTARNLAKLSQLITTFQTYYHINIITEKNKKAVCNMFFISYFKFLLDLGIDDYEDPYNPTPKGHVQIMTIHQSKGLEFPVVVVGSLDKKKSNTKPIDHYLSKFFHRPVFEPENRIDEFDSMRQYYVAFSRAAKMLVLTTSNKPNNLIMPIWTRVNKWSEIKSTLKDQKFNSRIQKTSKRSYSLTSHMNTFELCPLKYQIYQEYGFSPSWSSTRTFGNLVHQTLDIIHQMIIDEKLNDITNEIIIDKIFEQTYQNLLSMGMQPLSKEHKNVALDHILDYFNQNYDLFSKILKSELDISVEKAEYIISGKIDLLLFKDGQYEIIDFKTEKKPDEGDTNSLQQYYKQLYTYAYILKEKYGKYPHRLYIYWTSIEDSQQALMEIPFNSDSINSVEKYFDYIINDIQNKDFKIRKIPEFKICNECDIKNYCVAKGTIKLDPKSKSKIILPIHN